MKGWNRFPASQSLTLRVPTGIAILALVAQEGQPPAAAAAAVRRQRVQERTKRTSKEVTR